MFQESHHIVLDHSIFQRCDTRPHNKAKTFDKITKKEKMFCSDCKHDWGIIASYMNIQVHYTHTHTRTQSDIYVQNLFMISTHC